MAKILVADDEINILNLYRIRLEKKGYQVITCSDGVETLQKVVSSKPDLLLLDVMMPKMDGLQVLHALRCEGMNIPCIMVTAKGELEDKRIGFEEGVDDYLVKPFEFDELLMRITALLRRNKINSENKIQVGTTLLDFSTLSITNTVTKTKITLSKKEFSILYKLLSYDERTFTKEQLFDEFWGFDKESDLDSVKVYISRIRSQIKDFPNIDIETVRGIGYRGMKNEKK